MDTFYANTLNLEAQLSFRADPIVNQPTLTAAIRKKKPDALVVIGMGGSGLPGDIISALAHELALPVPVFVHKDFGLPALPYKNPLFIFLSFSGNTQETLSGFRLANRYPLRAVITGGGTLKQAAIKNTATVLIPQEDLLPRQATILFLRSLFTIFTVVWPNFKIPKLEMLPAEELESVGKAIAKKIAGKIACIYTATENRHWGTLLKSSLNETGKTLALTNTYPELNHNEVVAFEQKPKNVIVLLPVTPSETFRAQTELQRLTMLFKKSRTPLCTFTIPGATPIARTLNCIVLSQWIGYYTATLTKVNPEKTPSIDWLKKVLS